MALNAQQRAFVAAYDGNATQAAIAAGYSPKTARQQGNRLLTIADIQDAIKKRSPSTTREKRNIATREERQAFWTDSMQKSGVEMRDRLKASELLGKSEGDFLDRVEHSGELVLTVTMPEGFKVDDSYSD